MKSTLTLFSLLFILSSSAFSQGINLTNGHYKIDPAHTRVSFLINHFVVSQVEGRFNDVQGSFTLNDKIENSKVDVTVQIGSIDTGVKQRDDHLRSPDFFDAKKFPTMTFKSKKFSGSKEDFKVAGDLTIKDVTKEVVLTGKYTGSARDPYKNERAAVKASGKINRKDFNIKYNDMIDIGPAVGDEVIISILTEGILEPGKK